MLHVRATRTSLLRAVRTGGTGQLARVGHYCTYIRGNAVYACQSQTYRTYRVPWHLRRTARTAYRAGTPQVAAGEELLTCYGADYWLALTCGRPEGAPALELTEPIRGAVADSAACLRERAQGVARDYAADAAALEAVFAQLSADGGE